MEVKGPLITLTAAAIQTEEGPALDAMIILRLEGPAEDRLSDLFALRARLSVPGARLRLEMVSEDAETAAPAECGSNATIERYGVIICTTCPAGRRQQQQAADIERTRRKAAGVKPRRPFWARSRGGRKRTSAKRL
jgi:hypothetical protein